MPKRKSLRPELEALEERSLLATLSISGGFLPGHLTYTASNNVANNLTVREWFANYYEVTDSAETITLTGPGTFVAPSGSGTNTVRFFSSNIESWTVNVGNMSDQVKVEFLPAGDPMTINAADGNDLVIVGKQFTSGYTLDDVDADVTVNGGPGNGDFLAVRDNAPGGSTYSVTAGAVTYRSGLFAPSISFTSVEEMSLTTRDGGDVINLYANPAVDRTINASSGADTINVYGNNLATTTTINSGAGNDVVSFCPSTSIPPSAQDLSFIKGVVTVSGSSGNDALFLYDQNNAEAGLAYTLTSSSVTRPGMAINYNSIESGLVLHGNSGANTVYNVNGTSGSTSTTLNTGTGANTVYVTATSGPLTINGQGGADTVIPGGSASTLNALNGAVHVTNFGGSTGLQIRDQNDLTADTATLTATGLTGMSPAPITWVEAHLRYLQVYAGLGNDLITVSNTPNYASPSQTTINSGAGDDVINVHRSPQNILIQGGTNNDTVHVGNGGFSLGSFGGTVDVQGGVGNNFLFVTDQSATGAHVYTLGSGLVQRDFVNKVTFGGVANPTITASPHSDIIQLSGITTTGQYAVNAGTGDDWFQMLPGTYLGLALNGQAGSDFIDYSAYAGDVYVWLLLNYATDTSAVSGIEHVLSGSGNDILRGDYGDNYLYGGGGHDILVGDWGYDVLDGAAGRDILIGGYNADYLEGGADDDVLIAGPTAYDYDDTALVSLWVEWTRTDLAGSDLDQYYARAIHVIWGGGFNDPYLFDWSTVYGDGEADILSDSGGGQDLYYATLAQDPTSWDGVLEVAVDV